MTGAKRPSSAWLLLWTLVVFVAWTGCNESHPSTPPKLEAALQELLGEQSGPIQYFAAKANLDGDEQSEWIVHVAGPMVCGTGGCDSLVFTETDAELRLLTRISLTRPPIAIAQTSTNGWRDLIVHVAGGGILPGRDARLRYDGSTYPSNPTVEPAEPISERGERRVLIPAFESFVEGTRLR
jgi:hypothetical protein